MQERILKRATVLGGSPMKKLFFNNKPAMTLYSDLLAGIKIRIRQAQNRAVMSVNTEMLCLYWDIGRMVAIKQDAEGWGRRRNFPNG